MWTRQPLKGSPSVYLCLFSLPLGDKWLGYLVSLLSTPVHTPSCIITSSVPFLLYFQGMLVSPNVRFTEHFSTVIGHCSSVRAPVSEFSSRDILSNEMKLKYVGLHKGILKWMVWGRFPVRYEITRCPSAPVFPEQFLCFVLFLLFTLLTTKGLDKIPNY